MRSPKLRLALAALAACASLAACGSSSDEAATTPAATATATATNGTGQTGKVSANTASESEIAAALQAAGVDNAGRWAREVVEYRPYEAGDADLTSLRQNLAKYNPGQETVDKIVSALTP
ncbi:hypothetical protein [Sphaerisporangium perillae]|uniref:hypothetical protein n=1 Tax=Sphaerisporangium perillae TaxID=2935860 RepID=UPI00200C04F1|nr:hypothetical protein [Sphaerisporangium perillae]